MCSASFCHWTGSRAMLLIFKLRRLFILGDGSLFSLLSLTPRDEAASKSGLWGGDGPSATQRHQRFRLKSSRNKIHNFLFCFPLKTTIPYAILCTCTLHKFITPCLKFTARTNSCLQLWSCFYSVVCTAHGCDQDILEVELLLEVFFNI